MRGNNTPILTPAVEAVDLSWVHQDLANLKLGLLPLGRLLGGTSSKGEIATRVLRTIHFQSHSSLRIFAGGDQLVPWHSDIYFSNSEE